MYTKIILLFLFTLNIYAQEVVTTLPEFEWIVNQLSPETKTHTLLRGTEDPHFVDASPGFIFKLANAKLLVLNGMQLEIGWLPKIIEMSGNKNIQTATKGYCDASKKVSKLGVVEKYDRSMGDVHSDGNPHYTISIPRMIEASESIKDCLLQSSFISKSASKEIKSNFLKLKKRLQITFKEIKDKTRKSKFYVYHQEFAYLEKDFDLKLLQSLEKTPGVLPSASYLARKAKMAKSQMPKKVLAGSTGPKKILDKFKEMSGIDYDLLPLHPEQGEDYLLFIKKLMVKIND